MAVSSERVQLTKYEVQNVKKPEIPILNHVVTDKDLDLYTGISITPVNLSNVLKLITDPHSSDLCERHVHALKKVIHHHQYGFLVKDFLVVFKIMNECFNRLSDNPTYEEPLEEMIKLCGKPCLKEKVSDDLAYEQIFIECLSSLGYMMRANNQRIKRQICRTIYEFYTTASAEYEFQDMVATLLPQRQRLIDNSDVANSMTQSLLLANDENMFEEVLTVLDVLCQNSDLCCARMLEANAAYIICNNLNRHDPSKKSFFISVAILWNLIESEDGINAADQLANHNCIKQLRDAFVYELSQSFSSYHRQLRNDILAVVNLIASKAPYAPFIENGFAKELSIIASFQEVKNHSALVKHLRLSRNSDDFEMKKLLFSLIVEFSTNPAVFPVLSEAHVIPALFFYVRENEMQDTPGQWNPAQFEELQLLAMSCLSILAPLLLPDYISCQGNTRLLIMLQWCVSGDDFRGFGNSFHGTGGRGNKRAQMRLCLRLLRSITALKEALILQELADLGLIDQITVVLNNAVESKDDDDAVDVEMQSDMLIILASLCNDSINNKTLFGELGVDVVTSYLKMDPTLITDGLKHHKLLISAIDAVWSCVVGCDANENYFLSKKGVSLLLNITQYVPRVVISLILGCLLDFCENPKTVASLQAWQSKDRLKIQHLLFQFWRDTEDENSVKYDLSGIITDIQNPLRTEAQEAAGVVPLPADYESPSIIDVAENMRAKIYALVNHLGIIDHKSISSVDQITLAVIEKYLDLKTSEVWMEIRDELATENVRPISPDAIALKELCQSAIDRNSLLRAGQMKTYNDQLSRELLDEKTHYAKIKENSKQKLMTLHNFQDFVYRTSNYEYLKEAKLKQMKAINDSVPTNLQIKTPFHATYNNPTGVTAFSNIKVEVETTPQHLTGGRLVRYDFTTGEKLSSHPHAVRDIHNIFYKSALNTVPYTE